MLFKMALRNIFKYKRKSITVFITVAISIFIFILLGGMIEGMKDMFGSSFFDNIGHIMVYGKGYYKKSSMMPIDILVEKPGEIIEKIKQVHGVRAIRQEIKFPAMLIFKEESMDIVCRGVDFKDTNALKRQRKGMVAGTFPKNREGCIIGRPVAEDLKLSLGDKIVVMTSNSYGGVNAVEMKVSGIFDTGVKDEDESFIFLGIDRSRQLLQIDKGVTEITVILDDYLRASVVADQISFLEKEYNIEVLPWEKTYKSIKAMVKLTDIMMYIMFGIVVVIVSSGIINTFLISTFERIRYIGMMRSIGMRKFQVLVLLVTEAVLIGFAGAVIGDVLGAWVVHYYSIHGINLGEASAQMSGLEKMFYMKLTMNMLLSGIGLGVLISALGALYPGMLAVKMKPVDALRR